MTSTPFNVGLGDGGRLSSRVLRPPGGGHTDIFGGDPEPPRGRRHIPLPATAEKEEQPNTNGTEQVAQNGQSNPTTPQEVAPAPPAQETKTEEPVKPVEQPEAPKRVRVPPGGFSSRLW